MSDYPLDFTPQCPQVAWLAEHLGGWQFGEQDLLLAVADALDVRNGIAEIGAGDGEELPLTIDRLYVSGRSCILFEANDDRRKKLSAIYDQALICGAYCESGFAWKRDARQKFPDIEIMPDLVVIDIDSHDSQIMQQVMKRDRPAVVVCEHMDRCYPIGTSAPSPFPIWSLGHELTGGFRIQDTSETLQWMSGNLGYERFGFNRCNSFFVRQDRFADLFR